MLVNRLGSEADDFFFELIRFLALVDYYSLSDPSLADRFFPFLQPKFCISYPNVVDLLGSCCPVHIYLLSFSTP